MDSANMHKLYESKNTIIYKSKIDGYSSDVVVKVLKTEYPTDAQLKRFNNEFEFTFEIPIKGVRKSFKKETLDNRNALLLAYFEGETLKKRFAEKEFNLSRFLQIAIKSAEILGELHLKNIIHRDINSNNILINENDEISFIDFGISTRRELKVQNNNEPEQLEGTLSYISPEQTGRMNRAVDYRTDLYSFGIVLYELLTGSVPYNYSDSIKLVHAHIAEIPIALSSVNSKIPKVLSEIVLKLISKNADDRYQSAFGLKYDLEFVFNNLSDVKETEKLKIGENDFSGRIDISEEIFGRSDELEFLKQAYDRVSVGSSEIVLITGKLGVGKTSLVQKLSRHIDVNNGVFIDGKFELLKQNTPYFALTKAFSGFVNFVLTQKDEDLAYWKNILQNAVGNIGKVLTNFLPELELIIGEQPEIPVLEGVEAHNRFNYIWTNIIKAVCSPKHPLVLFIDDVQWADTASLELLKTILLDFEINYFLCIVAYPQKEVNNEHAVSYFVKELKSKEVLLSKIEINNLDIEGVRLLVEKVLRLKEGAFAGKLLEYNVLGANLLSEIIYTKTKGNAFFSIQLLISLFEEKLLYFDFNELLWKWDFIKIEKLKPSDNVIELMSMKTEKLPEKSQDVLKVAACIGNSFSIDFLALIYHENENETSLNVQPAVNESLLLLTTDNNYKFVDERIQQAVYESVNEKDKEAIHFRIGKALLKSLSKEEQRQNTFNIANHFNQCISLITDENEQFRLAELNYFVGKKVKESAAFESALSYLEKSRGLLGSNSWKRHYKFSLRVNDEYAELLYLNGKYDETKVVAKSIIKNTNSGLDKINAYYTLINMYRARQDYEQAVNVGLEIIRQLGLKKPSKTSKLSIISQFVKLKLSLVQTKPEDILEMPEMTNKRILGLTKILGAIGSSAYLSNPDLLPYLSIKIMRLMLRYGTTVSTSYAYAGFGIILTVMNKTAEAHNYAAIALKLLNSFRTQPEYAKVHFTVNLLIYPWTTAIYKFKENFPEISKKGFEIGDIEFSAYALSSYNFFQAVTGNNIQKLYDKSIDDLELFRKYKQTVSINRQKIFLQYYEALLTSKNKKNGLKGDYFDIDTDVEKLIKVNDLSTLCYAYIYNTELNYRFGNYEEAIKSSEETIKYLSGIKANYLKALHNFYYSLSLLALYRKQNLAEQKKTLKIVDANQKDMKKWSEYCPANFLHKYNLVQAEKSRLLNDNNLARSFYDEAILGAQENKFLNEEALAWELALAFYIENKINHLTDYYFQKAFSCYTSWGTIAKIKQLEEKYEYLLIDKSQTTGKITDSSYSISTTSSSTQNVVSVLDMSSIIKASQSLSGEVKLEKLLKTMMLIIMENAGAERGMIINSEDGKFRIEAEGKSTTEVINILKSIPIEKKQNLPKSIIKYVIRTKNAVVLDNAISNKTYGKDEYIRDHNVKSVLCHPIVSKNKISAILYLENNLSTNIFTKKRIEIVNMLSSQMAISIENALLYGSLESKVEIRTKELVKANKNITDSIHYAKRIQTAILPPVSLLKNITKEYFVMFRPRDIVSGDFFWAKQVGDYDIVIAADCTGHGVPGAFLSLLGISFLEKIILSKQNKIVAADILNELRLDIKTALHQTGEDFEQKDGMDMAILCFNRKTRSLQYSGAYNPLYIITNVSAAKKIAVNEKFKVHQLDNEYELNQTHVLVEVKADSMPIGIHLRDKRAFTNHEILIKETDKLYIFTDGYIDQFGGDNARKFLNKSFRDLLLTIHNKPFVEQNKIFNETFDKWKGNLHQLDDVLVIGMRF